MSEIQPVSTGAAGSWQTDDRSSCSAQTAGEILIRPPHSKEGAAVHALAISAGGLDVNSVYFYVLMINYFTASCRVAVTDEGLVGFVIGFYRPDQPQCLFIWQVGVAAPWRGRGLAEAMILSILRHRDAAAQYLEATICPANKPSRRLFARLSRTLRTDIKITTGFTPDMFGNQPHESEDIVRIGPISMPAGKPPILGEQHHDL